jgi:hypothetical protein
MLHTVNNEFEELGRLREPPSGRTLVPPPRTALQELPFEQLDWADFEKLCERLAALEGEPERVARYGTGGQEQAGIDIYSRLPGGKYVVYQCKRHQKLYPSTIRNAVGEFLKHGWSRTAGRFVFCTSKSLVPTSLADEVEAQATLLRARVAPIEFGTWDLHELSRKLKSHPDIVEDFFGPPFRELFTPGEAGRAAESAVGEFAAQLERLHESLGQRPSRVVVTTLAWAPEALRGVLQQLADEDQTAFLQLRDLVGEPPQTETVLANVDQPAAWLAEAPPAVWQALALMAERAGEWSPASRAWEQAASLEPDDHRAAGYLVSGAASAQVVDDEDGYQSLLTRASARQPQHPRLRLEQVRDLPASEQLEQLAEVEGVEAADVALIAAHKALAALLLPDIEQAERLVEQAVSAAAESVAAQAVAINLAVQRARLNTLEGRPQQAAPLRQANRDALALRDRLLRQRRWQESGRVLMLAADALALQGDFAAARELLTQATPEERAERDIADVLGNAALRALGPREAFMLTEGSEPANGIRRIRATATLELGGSPAHRAGSIAALDELIESGGEEASEAAFARLDDALGHGDWSDAAATWLATHGHERVAVILEALYLGRRRAAWEEAYALVESHQPAPWAAIARLRVATSWGRHSAMRTAADAVMAVGPGQALKVECGRAYARIGEFDRAREVLMQVATDDNASGVVRAEAYFLLVSIVGPRLGQWNLAGSLLREWIKVRPGDSRASTFAPTIAHRVRAERDLSA